MHDELPEQHPVYATDLEWASVLLAAAHGLKAMHEVGGHERIGQVAHDVGKVCDRVMAELGDCKQRRDWAQTFEVYK